MLIQLIDLSNHLLIIVYFGETLAKLSYQPSKDSVGAIKGAVSRGFDVVSKTKKTFININLTIMVTFCYKLPP